MKDLCQYGNRPEDEWEILPWIPDPRPPFKIWVKPEQIAPFFLIPHHPYAISLLLKISDGFRTEEFCRLGLTGSSGDWERLVRGVIREFEENNSGVDLFHFDSDEDVFCVYSQYIDDLMMLAKMIRAACADEKRCGLILARSSISSFFWEGAPEGIYINDMYKKYQDCGDLEKHLMAACDFMERAYEQVPVVDVDSIMKDANEKIVFQLINTEQNKTFLEQVPHREFQDLSIVYKVIISADKDAVQSSKITNEFAKDLE